jgi:serine protease 16
MATDVMRHRTTLHLPVDPRFPSPQTCAEFAYFQSCEPGSGCPFSSLMTLDSSFQICRDAFGPAFDEAVTRDRVAFSNAVYGGKDVTEQVPRILWVNGLVDPWHALSVLPADNANPANAAVVIPTGAHCRAMLPSSPTDPEDVKAARAASAAVLAGWLAQQV